MRNEEEVKVPTIGMLLDIEHIYGEHESRMGPVVIVIAAACTPVLIYVYCSLWSIIPIWLFAILDLLLTAFTALVVLGKQPERVSKYKKQLYSDYSEPADLMNIATIHPDGCVEFLNGTIYYYVCAFNGTIDDSVQRSIQLRKLIENMVGDYEYDTYLINIDDAPALKEYYEKVATFEKSKAAYNFVGIIDHNIGLVADSSVVMCTVYAIRGTRSDWKIIANQIDMAINSRMARCYKSIYRMKDPDEINSIINRDADTVINIPELLRAKYANDHFGSSKVLAYDLPDDMEIVQGGTTQSLVPEHTNHGFHKVWKSAD